MKPIAFLEVDGLKFSEDIKDELRLSILHGDDIFSYLQLPNLTADRLREIRLATRANVPEQYMLIQTNLLKRVRQMCNKGYSIEFLSEYINKVGKETISSEVLKQVLDVALQGVDVSKIDFKQVIQINVPRVLESLQKGTRISILKPLAYTKVYLEKDVFDFLFELADLDINVEPFIQGKWTKEQILEISRGAVYCSPDRLIKEYVSNLYSPNQIREVVRALRYEPSQAKLLTKVDKDGYPLYNEYQMYELVEGMRFKLDIMKYCNPKNSDFMMRKVRETLINEAENRGVQIRSKLRIINPNAKLGSN